MPAFPSSENGASLNAELIAAARDGRLDRVKSLLADGANIEARDSSGDTSLNEAARTGHLEVLKYLLSQGAILEAPNNDGKTALLWARANNKQEILDFLETYTPNPWVKLDDDTIAHIKYWMPVQRKVTEVFNLASRERFLITENMKTHAEAMTSPSSFDDLPDTRLQEVAEQAKALGLTVDVNNVLSNKPWLPKNKLS